MADIVNIETEPATTVATQEPDTERPRRALAGSGWPWLALLVLGLGGVLGQHETAVADDLTVPISLQLDLLNRVAPYESHFSSHAGSEAIVLVVTRRGVAESARAAGQIEAGMRRSRTLGRRPVRVEVHVFTTAAALRAAVDATNAAIAYLTPGLEAQVRGIAEALDGASVLTVSAVGSDADRGAVLAFELVAARPSLVVNLPQARRQRVAFSSQFLRLARVIQ